jgi:hypothetical protein
MKGKVCIYNLPTLVLFLSFALFISASIIGLPQETYAAVTERDLWTNIYTGATNNTSGTINAGSLTVSTAGSNRLFLAAVCLEQSGGWSNNINMTLGGTALTTIGNTGTVSAAEHCYIGYLKESQIPVGSKTLSVTYSTLLFPVTGIHVKWASYSDVNQTIPVSDSKANTSAAASVTFGDQIDYAASGLTLYVAANGGTPASIPTQPSGFSQFNIETTNGHSSFIAQTGNHASNGNYASGTTVTFGGTTDTKSSIVVAAISPLLATMVGNNNGQPSPQGEPPNVTIGPAPNGGATELDAFTLQTSKGETYYYVVTAVNTAGGESGYSNKVRVNIIKWRNYYRYR